MVMLLLSWYPHASSAWCAQINSTGCIVYSASHHVSFHHPHPHHSARVSPKLRIPLQKTQDYLVTYEDGTQEEETQVVGATAYCPPFSYTEFLVMACHYSETVMSLFSRDRTDPEVDVIFDRAYQLMQGDARAFRTTVIWEMNNVQLGSYQGEDGKAIE